jgi:hypothetical protein
MDRNNVIPDHQSFEPRSLARAMEKRKGNRVIQEEEFLNDLLLLSIPKQKQLNPNRIVCFIVMLVEHFYFPSARNFMFPRP